MNSEEILQKFKDGDLNITEALKALSHKGIEEMGFATIDTDRLRRTGMPEVIYAAGKTVDQVKDIALRMYNSGIDVLATKVNAEMYLALKPHIPEIEYNELAETLSYKFKNEVNEKGYIAIVAAGTSDMPVAEEAAITAKFLGNRVETIYDVGVAGIHRLFHKLDIIQNARVIIVVAGMEGALGSVIGGLVDKPVIGVPTSVGYGANFGGLSALLSMLNSCASGISVVNINNGFGAACQASLINKM